MKDLDVKPKRPDLPIFETLGHTALTFVVVAVVVAAVGVVLWFAVPRFRGSRLIVRLWAACAIVGCIAAVSAWLFLG